MRKRNILIAVIALLFMTPSFASKSDVIVRTINVNPPSGLKGAAQTTKVIYIMPLPFDAQQKKKLLTPQLSSLKSNISQDNLPAAVNNGMNGVPVLDQGMHGSCVTFAITAAVDALLGQGDYASQLCNLELGSYLEPRSYMYSGWDGSMGEMVLSQMMTYGMVNKTKQTSVGCAGVTQYPLMDPNNQGMPISLEEFKQKSEILTGRIYWEKVLSFQQRFNWTSMSDPEWVLQKVKQLLVAGQTNRDSRLSFAVALPVDYCSVGACGTYHARYDSWVMSSAIKNDSLAELGGHQMIIFGYDDNAVAVDNEGSKHKGLLILRNSWSTEAGDQGNYYMSYDFFKQFVYEIQEIKLDKTR